MIVTHYTDAMPDGPIDPADAPPPALERWLRSDPPLPQARAYMRWTDVLGAELAPGPHTAQPDDLALLPYTSGTTGCRRAACTRTAR